MAMGLRSAIGAFIGGILYDGLGAVALFRFGGISALLGLLFLILASRRRLEAQTGSNWGRRV